MYRMGRIGKAESRTRGTSKGACHLKGNLKAWFQKNEAF
jgi:hypothetical protein